MKVQRLAIRALFAYVLGHFVYVGHYQLGLLECVSIDFLNYVRLFQRLAVLVAHIVHAVGAIYVSDLDLLKRNEIPCYVERLANLLELIFHGHILHVV